MATSQTFVPDNDVQHGEPPGTLYRRRLQSRREIVPVPRKPPLLDSEDQRVQSDAGEANVIPDRIQLSHVLPAVRGKTRCAAVGTMLDARHLAKEIDPVQTQIPCVCQLPERSFKHQRV